MITSRLTSKAQTTVPQPVRRALDLKAGDELAYTIEDQRVIVTKAQRSVAAPRREQDDPFVLFDEWAGEADERAYRDL